MQLAWLQELPVSYFYHFWTVKPFAMILTDLVSYVEFLLISQQGLERKLNLVFPHSRLVVDREDLPNASHPILTSIVKKTKNKTPP